MTTDCHHCQSLSPTGISCELFNSCLAQAIENVNTYGEDEKRPWPDRIVILAWGVNRVKASWLHADHVQADSFVLHFHAVQSLSSHCLSSSD